MNVLSEKSDFKRRDVCHHKQFGSQSKIQHTKV